MLHHYPICVSYALFDDGKIPVADPTVLEEKISNASIVLAINSYKELCSMHLTGVTLTSPKLIQKCSEMAAERARRIVEYIKHTLEENKVQRESGIIKGLSQAIKLSNVTSNFHDAISIEKMEAASGDESDDVELIEERPIIKIDQNTVSTDKWNVNDESSGDDEEMQMPAVVAPKKKKKQPKMEVIEQSSGEEEETIILK